MFAAFCNDPDTITMHRAIRTATHTTQSPGITGKFREHKELHIYIVPPNHLAQLNQNITIVQIVLETAFFPPFLFKRNSTPCTNLFVKKKKKRSLKSLDSFSGAAIGNKPVIQIFKCCSLFYAKTIFWNEKM